MTTLLELYNPVCSIIAYYIVFRGIAKFSQSVGLLTTTLIERLVILLEEAHSHLDSSLAMPLADSCLLFINGRSGLELPFLGHLYINMYF